MNKKPLALIILDGFGYDARATESPWQIAKHPNFSEIEKFFPFMTLQASGIAVGLPWGEEGNSEVGHLTMGSGKIIFNHLPRIITAISDGSFFENESFLAALKHIQKTGGNLHLMGLYSSGSVHAYAEHLHALLDFTKKNGVLKTYLHLFTDGRDAPLNEAADFFLKLEKNLEKNYSDVKIASVIGRYFAMDRDDKWEKIEKAYNLFVKGEGEEFEHASMYIEKNYKNNKTDEFVEPGFGRDTERIKNGDAVIYFNYREDSARELASAFVQDVFDKFPRQKLADLSFVTMTEYSSELEIPVAFLPIKVGSPLAKVISLAGLKQLHIAETEKYAHVTYFFNGGKEDPFEEENRILIPSPHTVHYDDAPEMSAQKITDKVLEEIGKHDFFVINFANTDMVGHTGNFKACVKAIEVLDGCVGQIIPKILENDGALIITSDHGNVEEKLYKMTGEKRTKHTANPVPIYLIGKEWQRKEPLTKEEISGLYKKVDGTLTDVAPTILEILGIPKPEEMTGKSLISKLK